MFFVVVIARYDDHAEFHIGFQVQQRFNIVVDQPAVLFCKLFMKHIIADDLQIHQKKINIRRHLIDIGGRHMH